MVLTNVHYVIEAEFEMLPEKAASGDNPGKFQDIVTRRMRKGQCFSTPYFGCREFPAHFKQWEGGPIPTIDETRDLGFMLYDFDYSDPQNITPLYFRAKMEHGVHSGGRLRGVQMILQALVQYYEALLARGEIDRPGWSKVNVSWRLT